MKIKKNFIFFFYFISLLYILFFFNVYFNVLKYEILINKNNSYTEIFIKIIISLHETFEITNQSIIISAENIIKKNFNCCKNKINKNNFDIIKLRINDNSLYNLTNNLPESGRNYQKGEMLYSNGNWENIKFRLRGQSNFHHNINLPSLRLNLKKNKSIKLMNHINLTKPEDPYQISNYYNDFLAEKIDIMNQKTKLALLEINKKQYGLYHIHHRRDENLIRANFRMPGPLFVLNNGSRIWKPEDFEILGEIKLYDNFSLIEKLIEIIYKNPSTNNFQELWEITDKEKFAKYYAYLNLIGGIHSDYKHNIMLYFDPSKGKFEPIVDDPLGQGTLTLPRTKDRIINKNKPPDYRIPLYERLQPLYDFMLRDSSFIHLKNEYLYKFLNDFGSIKNQQIYLRDLYNKYEVIILNDTKKRAVLEMLTGFKSIPLSNYEFKLYKKKLFQWIEYRNNYLLKEIEKNNVNIELYNADDSILISISYKTNGNILFDIEKFGKDILINQNDKNKVYYNKNDKTIKLKSQLIENKTIEYAWTKDLYREYYLEPGTVKIVFKIKSLKKDFVKDLLEKSFTNEITKNNIEIKFNSINSEVSYDNNYYVNINKISNIESNNEIIIENVFELKKDLIIKENEILTIKAGTQILIEGNVSIISFGKVNINGTKKKPVIIKAKNQQNPWGVIAILGTKTSGSNITHANISGGSSARFQNIFLKGMISAHWTKDFKIINSNIYQNFIGDDAINLVNSEIKILSSNIFNCNMDCVDLDYSSGIIENSLIYQANNDLIDFMSSKVKLNELNLYNSGDNALSVGEGSDIFLNNSRIENSITGIASKDDSKIIINNSSILNNNIGLSSYRKNFTFSSPGSIIVDNSIISNIVNVKSDNLKYISIK